MAQYSQTRPSVVTGPSSEAGNGAAEVTDASNISEFDKHRETLLTGDAAEGWASELRRYLGTMQWEVTKDTDVVEWWQASDLHVVIFLFTKLDVV
jgi:hypothetical protein